MANIFISDIFIVEAGLLTVSKVIVTDDLKLAKVYLSLFENKIPANEVLSIIKSKHNNIRHHLSSKINLRYTPQLRFYHDNALEYAQNIDILIQKLHQND